MASKVAVGWRWHSPVCTSGKILATPLCFCWKKKKEMHTLIWNSKTFEPWAAQDLPNGVPLLAVNPSVGVRQVQSTRFEVGDGSDSNIFIWNKSLMYKFRKPVYTTYNSDLLSLSALHWRFICPAHFSCNLTRNLGICQLEGIHFAWTTVTK